MAAPLSSSYHSMASSTTSARTPPSHVARIYRQAAQLFLTRRLPEALSTIEPITCPESFTGERKGNGAGIVHGYASDAPGRTDGYVNGDNRENGTDEGAVFRSPPPPIAVASRGTRVKVWSFYISLLNAIIELGPDQGKAAFGITRWRSIVRSVRDGTIWDDVVHVGYNDEYGVVDTDVIINLATLLLTHASSQVFTQQKLEAHLAATAHPTFDLTGSNFSTTPTAEHPFPRRQSASNNATPTLSRRPSHTPLAGASTPRDLHARLKLLELYALHVLPRNSEWELARAFLDGSELLDDERRDAFIAALDGLRAQEEEEARERQLREEEAQAQERARRRQQQEEAEVNSRRKERASALPSTPLSPPSSSSHANPNIGNSTTSVRPRNPHAHTQRATDAERHTIINPRISAFIRAINGLLRAAGLNITLDPAQLPSFLLSSSRAQPSSAISSALTTRLLLAAVLIWIMAARRVEVRRLVGVAWGKVLATVGMGTRVTYL